MADTLARLWQELRGLAATVVLPADDRAEPSCGDTNVHVALFSRGDAGSMLLAVILKKAFCIGNQKCNA